MISNNGLGTMPEHEIVRRLQSSVANMLTHEQQERVGRGERELSRDDERQLALSFIRQVVAAYIEEQIRGELDPPDDTEWDHRLVTAVDAAIYGAGELQELLDDESIENIDINGCDEVWITYADARGKTRWPGLLAPSDEVLIERVQNLAAYAGINARPWTPATPELDLRLQDGSRLSGLMSATERPAVSIRRNRYPQMFMSQLVELGTVTLEMAAFLQAAVLARFNIMVAGSTDAGKTTTLRALINCIPPIERLVTIESALELNLRKHPELHPDVVEEERVLPDADGKGGISIGQLVTRSRRQNPSRVICGEVLGGEVGEMLSAMSQGNNGSLSTIHARSAEGTFQKLCTYAAKAEGYAFDVTHALIAEAIDFVVYQRKVLGLGGLRCVTEVLEVTGYSGGRVSTAQIFGPSLEDGRGVRRDEVPISSERADELARFGYGTASVDDGWSAPASWTA